MSPHRWTKIYRKIGSEESRQIVTKKSRFILADTSEIDQQLQAKPVSWIRDSVKEERGLFSWQPRTEKGQWVG